MRSRNYKPGFFKNLALSEIKGMGGRLLFLGLWAMADREGRLADIPATIGAEIFPYDLIKQELTITDVDEILNELASAEFINRYEVDGKKFIQIINFKKHQNPHPREKPSEIPPKNQKVKTPKKAVKFQEKATPRTCLAVKFQEKATPRTCLAGLNPDTPDVRNEDVRNEDAMIGGEGLPPPTPDGAGPEPAFSCLSFEVSTEHLEALVERNPDFPASYLIDEFFPKMADWCEDHRQDPAHSKKFDEAGRLREPRRCLSNWLKREDPGKADAYRRPRHPPPLPPDPPGMQTVYDPGCAVCRGGGRDRDGPCACGRLEEIVDPDPDCEKCKGMGISKQGVCDCLKPRGGNGKGNESLDTRREAMTDQELPDPEAIVTDKLGAAPAAGGQELGEAR